MRSTFPVLFSTLLLLLASGCTTFQVAVEDAVFPVPKPAWDAGQGPRVAVDEAHFNYHTAGNRYKAFAEHLRRDGYVVEPLKVPFSAQALADVEVLVISNALARENARKWVLPTPSAFADAEVAAVAEWVEKGGALLLIADHMPFPGAAEKLGERLGFYFVNGYARDGEGNGSVDFRRDDGTLADHPITRGRGEDEAVDHVKTFGGQAFRAVAEVEPLFVFGPGSRVALPWKVAKFNDKTPQIPAEGLYQGAARRFGDGRVAVFGEAAMFSAQVFITGDRRFEMGMNHPDASQNPRFVLNLMHWLSGLESGE